MRKNNLTLKQALQIVADRSFYEDTLIASDGDGTYTVEDTTLDHVNDWLWSYDDGVQDLDSVDETSRLMEPYENFNHANHIEYHMSSMIELLKAGTHAVEFAYAIVYDEDILSDDDNIAGWMLVANAYELENN